MKPFLELPKIIINNEDKEKEVITRVRPDEIEDYYPGFYRGVVFVMKSQNSFLCPLSIDDVDIALSAYYEYVKENPKSFEVLKLTMKQKDYAAN